MPPLKSRRGVSAIPILLALSRLLSIPRSTARPAWKRSSEWVANAAAAAPVEPEAPPDGPIFWWKLGLSVVLVLLGGVFAGLTLALMGSDDLNLRVLSTSSEDPKERKAASKVLRLLQRGRHWVLVVLLLGNVIVNESLPIFLDDVLGGGLYAVIVSTTMIVIFGEIIPQAVCVRYGLRIGGACAPLVLGLMVLFFPVAYPIAKLLDYVLGRDEGHTYKKAELKSFLQFHREGDEPLRDDEIGILNGVLSLNEKRVQSIMTPINDCLTLPSNKVLDHATIDHILLSGFSRIPIHEPGQKDNFMGMLLVKRLITYNPEDEWPISKLNLLPLPEARPDINCFQALDYFQTGRAHLLLISETPGSRGGALGIVSLEDLIEEIIGEEIVDETDQFQDNRSRKIAKRAGTGAVMRGIIERHRTGGVSSRHPSSEGHTPLQLSLPNGTNDGLLIQFNQGALVAEPVSIPDDSSDARRIGGKRLVVGTGASSLPDRMESIEESSDMAPLLESRMEDAPIGDIDVDGEEQDGEIEVEARSNGVTGGGDNDDDEEILIGAGDEVMIPDALIFPHHSDFQYAAKGFLKRYAMPIDGDEDGDVDGDVGPSRTNTGWEWKEHSSKNVKDHGYLYRRQTRHVQSRHFETSDRPDVQGIETMFTDGSSDELKVEETDNLVSPSKDRLKTTGTREKIEVEHHIIYSPTYHVPQLLIRAWDSSGAPLSLSHLVSSALLRPGAQIQPSPDANEREDALLLDPHSPFPLIQQCEHPTTGDVVWSVHPCQISRAVEEVLASEGGRTKGDAREIGETDQSRDSGWWLEAWMMITSGVVDLAYA